MAPCVPVHHPWRRAVSPQLRRASEPAGQAVCQSWFTGDGLCDADDCVVLVTSLSFCLQVHWVPFPQRCHWRGCSCPLSAQGLSHPRQERPQISQGYQKQPNLSSLQAEVTLQLRLRWAKVFRQCPASLYRRFSVATMLIWQNC